MNDELISFETAKLGKEKGFKEIPIAPNYLINKEGVILNIYEQENGKYDKTKYNFK